MANIERFQLQIYNFVVYTDGMVYLVYRMNVSVVEMVNYAKYVNVYFMKRSFPQLKPFIYLVMVLAFAVC